MARKPLSEGTVAANVLKWGTGAINVDGCRVATDDGYQDNAVTQGINTAQTSYAPAVVRRTFEPAKNGRWPANVIHDGSEEVLAGFPDSSAEGHFPGNGGTHDPSSWSIGDKRSPPRMMGDSWLGRPLFLHRQSRQRRSARLKAPDRQAGRPDAIPGPPGDAEGRIGARSVCRDGNDRRSRLARRHAGGADRAEPNIKPTSAGAWSS